MKNLRNDFMNYNIQYVVAGVVGHARWKDLTDLYELEKKYTQNRSWAHRWSHQSTNLQENESESCNSAPEWMCCCYQNVRCVWKTGEHGIANGWFHRQNQSLVRCHEFTDSSCHKQMRRPSCGTRAVCNPKILFRKKKWKKPLWLSSKGSTAVLGRVPWMVEILEIHRNSESQSQVFISISWWIPYNSEKHQNCCNQTVDHTSLQLHLNITFQPGYALENFFSQIRSKGGNRDNPSTSEYEAACKNVAVNWILQTNSKNSNCKMDLDQFLGLMSARKVMDPVVPPGDLTTDNEFHPSDPNTDRINSATSDWTSIYTLSDIQTNNNGML